MSGNPTSEDSSPRDLRGQICPYPIMRIVSDAGQMAPGDSLRFLVDDPLAVKSVPEEFEDEDAVDISVDEQSGHWVVTLDKR